MLKFDWSITQAWGSIKPEVILFCAGDQSKYTGDILHKWGYRTRVFDWPSDIDRPQFGIVTIGDNYNREKVYKSVIETYPDIEWVNAIHPSCIIGENVKFGKGVVAMAGCVFNPGTVIGDFTFFATGAQIEHDCKIEDFASVSAGSVLGGHVTVKKYAAITMGCTIFDRVTIGENTVIGSGSLVTKDTPDNVLMYGSPAKVIRYRKPGEKWLS